MPLFSAVIDVTFSTRVFITADSAEEAKEQITNGEWDDEQPGEAVDWEDPQAVETVEE